MVGQTKSKKKSKKKTKNKKQLQNQDDSNVSDISDNEIAPKPRKKEKKSLEEVTAFCSNSFAPLKVCVPEISLNSALRNINLFMCQVPAGI